MPFNLITDLYNNSQADLMDRGLHYGDGLFETMLLEAGHINYWSEHYQRLLTSATRLEIPCPGRSWFEQQLQPFIDFEQTLVLKIILTRGPGGRGLQLPDDLVPNVYILHYPYSKDNNNQYVTATVSEITLPINKNLAGLKHLNRLDYVLATQQLKKRAGFNEALLVDTQGYVIESIINNLFFVVGNELNTPDLSESGVDGIFRNLIINSLKQTGKKVKIGHYTIQNIISADECFVCNSVQGIRPVIRIEETEFSIGPLTQQLQQVFHGSTNN